MTISRSIYVASDSIILFFIYGWVVFHCMYVPHLLYPFILDLLFLFQEATPSSTGPVNIRRQKNFLGSDFKIRIFLQRLCPLHMSCTGAPWASRSLQSSCYLLPRCKPGGSNWLSWPSKLSLKTSCFHLDIWICVSLGHINIPELKTTKDLGGGEWTRESTAWCYGKNMKTWWQTKVEKKRMEKHIPIRGYLGESQGGQINGSQRRPKREIILSLLRE